MPVNSTAKAKIVESLLARIDRAVVLATLAAGRMKWFLNAPEAISLTDEMIVFVFSVV